MPPRMWLRSSPRASSISDPGGQYSLARWRSENGRAIGQILHIEDFLDYGEWFQTRVVPDLDPRLVTNVERADAAFAITLDDGERFLASRVVVAAGLGPFAYVPPVFRELPGSLACHASASPDLERFQGRHVTVIGAGQSALESAALLDEAGAEVELLGRTQAIYWLGNWSDANTGADAPAVPTTEDRSSESWRGRTGLYWRPAPTEVGGRLSSWVGAAPDLLRWIPRRFRAPLTYHCIRPAGAYWLPKRLSHVKIELSRGVIEATPESDRVLLELDDGSQRLTDHVLLGTGYSIDVCRYPFLAPELIAGLRTVEGSPVLRGGLESSVPGLHFVGAAAAESFGPVMRFVIGTSYTGPALAQGITGKRFPVFRLAF